MYYDTIVGNPHVMFNLDLYLQNELIVIVSFIFRDYLYNLKR